MSVDSAVGLPPAQHVIQSKLRIPSLPERFDERPRVEKLLANLMTHKRAVVVTAAAGSGKTTAVAGAARRVRAPVAWLAVDRPDAAPGRLVTYLEAAIARLIPNASGVATSAVAAGIPHAEAAGLLAEAIGPTPLVLVLDELERIGQEPEPWRIIESLLRYLPLGASVVLISRHDVPTALCTLPPPPALGVVTDTDVAFTTEEAERALTRLGHQDIDAATAVAATAGWVTGVLYAGWRSTEDVRGQGGETDPLYEYLASQILADLEPPVRDFLVESSLLHEVTAERAEALGISAAAESLDALRAVHLPVSWDAGGRVMRTHTFFREYLGARLARRGAEPLRTLRVAHGRLLISEGHPEEAVEVLLRAGAPEVALAPAEQAILDVVERMDRAVAERWIAALAGVRRTEPSPLTTAELMLAIAGDEVARGVQMADRLAATGERDRLAASSDRAALLMAWCYLHQGRYDDVDALLAVAPAGVGVDAVRYAMSALTDRPGADRPEAPATRGGPLVAALLRIADFARGRLTLLTDAPETRWMEVVERPWRIAALRARGQTKDALEQYELAGGGLDRTPTMVLLTAPELLMDAGRWPQAEELIREGAAIAASRGSLAFIGMNRVDEAKLALRRHHDSAAARAALERPESRRARQTFAFIAELAGAWEGLALLLEDRDAEALRMLREAVESMQAGDRILELPVAAVYLAEAEWRAGDVEAADRSAQIALDAAGRQGSNHLLLQSLEFLPAVVSRMVEQSSDSDSPWHELGRALIAQGVSVNVPVAVPVRVLEFGRRALLVDGEEVRPRITKSYELLSYVIAQAHGECDRDQLLDALFDGRQDDSARAYLRQTIRWLREALPPEAFAAEGRTVRVGGALAVSSESVELESLLAEAARLRGRDRLEATLRALEIYDQGPYLPGPRGGWADERDQQLADQVNEARYQAAVLAFGEGRYDETRRLCEAVLRQEPYREAAWRLAIRVAQALGDGEGATRAFQGCTQSLAEIGAQPSSSTRMLLQRARR